MGGHGRESRAGGERQEWAADECRFDVQEACFAATGALPPLPLPCPKLGTAPSNIESFYLLAIPLYVSRSFHTYQNRTASISVIYMALDLLRSTKIAHVNSTTKLSVP